SERAAFIRRTYAHLAGAVLAFIVLEAILLNIPAVVETTIRVCSTRGSHIAIMLGFFAVSAIASYWASSQTSRGVQYLGLAVYVVAAPPITLPLLTVAFD